MKKHIEFLGIPGSGKTTIYKELSKDSKYFTLDKALWISLKRSFKNPFWKYLIHVIPSFIGIIKVHWFYTKTAHYAKYLAKFNAEHQKLLAIIFNLEIVNYKKDELYSWLNNLFSKYQFIQKNLTPKESLMLDEGFVQRSISLFGYSKSINWTQLELYVQNIPLPTDIYVINVDKDTSSQRMLTRKKGVPKRMKNLSKEEQKNVLINSNQIIKYIIPLLEQKGVNIIEIDNTSNVETAIKKIKSLP